MKITFIGGGNMATALIGGMIEEGYLPQNILVVDINESQLVELTKNFGINTATTFTDQLKEQDIIILAVKPQQLKDVCFKLKNHLNQQLILSIAAGVRTDSLKEWLGNYDLIVRSMPNTPALVQSGMTGLFALSNVNSTQKEQIETIIDAVGEYIWVDDESLLDAVTAVSGSGPAYVFYFIEALQQAGEQLGFNPEIAKKLAYATFKGSIKLASQSYETSAEILRHRVTSKGGTTEQAILHFEENNVKNHIINGVFQAKNRSEELADLLSKNS